MTKESELLTVPQAAKQIGKTPAALYAAIDRGDLPHVRRYERILIRPAVLRMYQANVKIGRPKNGNKKAGK